MHEVERAECSRGAGPLQLTSHARFRLSPKSRVLVRETADAQLRVLRVDARGGPARDAVAAGPARSRSGRKHGGRTTPGCNGV